MPVQEIFAGADHRADTCDLDTLAAQVANVAERHPGAVVSIAGYAMRTGSPSLALARVSLLVDRLQQSLLQKIGRQRVPLDARVVAEYEAASEPDLLGRIVLRLHTRSTP
jgi:hypothetical protein